MKKVYYQPVLYKDDGTNIEYGDIPKELYSFQVFKSREVAMDWLWQHDYDADEWAIVEYSGDDIEEPQFIDEYGDDDE